MNATGREDGAVSVQSRIHRMQFGCLLAALLMTLFFFLAEDRASGAAYLLVERYLALPAMAFLGVSVCRELPRKNRWYVFAGIAMIALFFVNQLLHQALESEAKQIGTFVCAYALFLPFAAATEDEKKQLGLKWMGGLFIAAGLLMTVYMVLLFLNAVPGYLKDYVKWDGTRFSAMGHPNICATLLMISIAFCAGFALQNRKTWVRIGLGVLVLPQFFAMSLTNGRTTIILTCLLLGGIAFCSLRGRGWKRFLPAILAAVVVMIGAFGVSRAVFAWNQDYLMELIARSTQSLPEGTQQMPVFPQNDALQTGYPQQTLVSTQAQGSLSDDMKTLNNRTLIWGYALNGLRDNPQVRFIGTEYVDVILSRYSQQPFYHTHNSWLEALYRMGLPGLAAALVITALAVWSALVVLWRNTDLWKSCIALLVICLLGCAMLEPYLFVADVSYFYLDFLFMLCLGYLCLWRRERDA